MPEKNGFRFFAPILAGANLRDRLIACLGALIGVCGTAAICGFLFRHDAHLPLIVAPVGASAVLLFAIPASPLAQPWPIIGGNSLSALIGLAVADLVPDPVLALGLALTLALAVMSLARCLHPPGGASALIAAMGGPLVEDFGYWYPLAPVALNSVLLVGFGILFHKLSRVSYPHKPPAAKPGAHRTQVISRQSRWPCERITVCSSTWRRMCSRSPRSMSNVWRMVASAASTSSGRKVTRCGAGLP